MENPEKSSIKSKRFNEDSPSKKHEYLSLEKRLRSKRIWKLIRNPLLASLALISLAFGIIGFQKYSSIHNSDYSLGTVIYAAIELFKGGGGVIKSPIPWELEISRWVSPGISAYAVLLGFLTIFRSQVQVFLLKFARNHIIICGLGEKGFELAKNLRLSDFRVTIIEKSMNNPSIQLCRDIGIPVIIGDARDEQNLRVANISHASSIVAFCGSDNINIEIVNRVRSLCKKRMHSKLTCYIHIVDIDLWSFIQRQVFDLNNESNIRLELFNIYEQGAKQIVHKYPFIDNGINQPGDPRDIILIGFGNLGKQLLLQITREWRIFNANPLAQINVTLIDKGASSISSSLIHQSSLIQHSCKLEIINADPTSPNFMIDHDLNGVFSANKDAIVFVCFDEEEASLKTALVFLRKINTPNIKLIIQMREDKSLLKMISEDHSSEKGYSNLFTFGLIERVCVPDLLRNGLHENLARVIHSQYIKKEINKGQKYNSSPSLVDWEYLPDEYREMNREQADDIRKKLSAIYCDIVPWIDNGAEIFQFSEGEIDLIASMEHKRWCDQKINQGWTYGVNRDEKRKKHPSLVDWKDSLLSEEERNKDRDAVKLIPNYLALAGFQIYRRKPVQDNYHL